MKVDNQTLERLSNLELESYAGDVDAQGRIFAGKDRELFEKLMNSPIEMRVIAQRGVCNNSLYEICLSVQGKYNSFSNLREEVINKYTEIINPSKKMEESGKIQSPWLLTVLLNGIYVGDPEDIRNQKKDPNVEMWYPTKGLGKKIAEVEFL